ncbi:MAG: hypothetical protein FJ149_10360 [Euryarchaeota archaeon]|nr:hypothetical protein [Euryarchaeota archaeon]
MMRMPPLWALALLLLAAALPALHGANTPGTAVTVSGPERLEVSKEGSYNVRIQGPALIKWGFWVNVTGTGRADVLLTSSDGTPDSQKPYTMSQNDPLEHPEFNFTLTAPPVAGGLTITVTAFAMEGAAAAGQTATGRWDLAVKARRDIELNATVRNSGEVAVQNLRVAFMVRLHGIWTYISNETVAELEPGARANVTTRWDTTLMDNGEYLIRVVVDPEGEKVMYTGSGSISERRVVLRDVGTREEEPWTTRYQRIIGFVAVLAVAAAIGVWWWRRKKIV